MIWFTRQALQPRDAEVETSGNLECGCETEQVPL